MKLKKGRKVRIIDHEDFDDIRRVGAVGEVRGLKEGVVLVMLPGEKEPVEYPPEVVEGVDEEEQKQVKAGGKDGTPDKAQPQPPQTKKDEVDDLSGEQKDVPQAGGGKERPSGGGQSADVTSDQVTLKGDQKQVEQPSGGPERPTGSGQTAGVTGKQLFMYGDNEQVDGATSTSDEGRGKMESVKNLLKKLKGGVKEADVNDYVEIARRYNELGWAVQEQLEHVLDNPSPETFSEQNPNALRMIAEFLAELSSLARMVGDDAGFRTADGLSAEIEGYLEGGGEEMEEGGNPCPTPGQRTRSRGRGRGLARGRGRGPMGVPPGAQEGVLKPISINVLEEGDKEDEYLTVGEGSAIRSEHHLVRAIHGAVRKAMESMTRPFDVVDVVFRRAPVQEAERRKAERDLLASLHLLDEGKVKSADVRKAAEAAAKLGVRTDRLTEYTEDRYARKILEDAIKEQSVGGPVSMEWPPKKLDTLVGKHVIIETRTKDRFVGTLAKGPGARLFHIKTRSGTHKFSPKDVSRILVKPGAK